MHQRNILLGALVVVLLWAPCFCMAGWKDSFDAYPSNSPLPAPWEDSHYVLSESTGLSIFQSAGDGGCKGKGTCNGVKGDTSGATAWSRAWRTVDGVSRLKSSLRVSTNADSDAVIGFTATKDTKSDQPLGNPDSVVVRLQSAKTGATLSFWIGNTCASSIPVSRNQWYDVQVSVSGRAFIVEYRQTGLDNWRRMGAGEHRPGFKIGYALVASRRDGYLDDISALTTPIFALNPEK